MLYNHDFTELAVLKSLIPVLNTRYICKELKQNIINWHDQHHFVIHINN